MLLDDPVGYDDEQEIAGLELTTTGSALEGAASKSFEWMNATCSSSFGLRSRRRDRDPLFHALLTAFGERSGFPVLLNTSFNDADEPIVCSPAHAIRTFLHTDLDALVLGSWLVRKAR